VRSKSKSDSLRFVGVCNFHYPIHIVSYSYSSTTVFVLWLSVVEPTHFPMVSCPHLYIYSFIHSFIPNSKVHCDNSASFSHPIRFDSTGFNTSLAFEFEFAFAFSSPCFQLDSIRFDPVCFISNVVLELKWIRFYDLISYLVSMSMSERWSMDWNEGKRDGVQTDNAANVGLV